MRLPFPHVSSDQKPILSALLNLHKKEKKDEKERDEQPSKSIGIKTTFYRLVSLLKNQGSLSGPICIAVKDFLPIWLKLLY